MCEKGDKVCEYLLNMKETFVPSSVLNQPTSEEEEEEEDEEEEEEEEEKEEKEEDFFFSAFQAESSSIMVKMDCVEAKIGHRLFRLNLPFENENHRSLRFTEMTPNPN